MQQLYDLEINILSCLLLKPELMKELKLEDKHFKKHQRLWQFMKAFYQRFETFDLVLMYNVCENKFMLMQKIEQLLMVEPAPSRFYEYQQQLIELYNQNKKDKWIINKTYELVNNLYAGNISLTDYEQQYNKLKSDADKIFETNI